MAYSEKTDATRRRFVVKTAAAVGGLLGATLLPELSVAAPGAGKPHPLPHRRLGSLDVSALGLGCMNLTGVYGHPAGRKPFACCARRTKTA